LARRTNQELDPYLTNPRELNETERKKLVKAIRDDAITKRLRALVEEEKQVLMQLRRAGITQADKAEIRTRLRKLISEETDIRCLPDSILFSNPNEEFDWMKITAQAFQRTVAETTCRLIWRNNLHPNINRGAWSKAEDKMLKQLV
jgi:hypothetical protein